MKSTNMSRVVACSIVLFGWAASASATTISYFTGSTNVGGHPVNAEVTFSTGTNVMTVTVQNLQSSFNDIAQAISGVSFALSNLKTSTTISSSAGVERTVNSNKTFSDGLSVPTGWEILLDGQSMQLMLPDGMSDHSIIGPANANNKYGNANSSVAGNSNNNAFLSGPVSFVIPVQGITSATTVDWAVFHFGICAEYLQACNSAVPEPSTMTLVGLGLACGAVAVRRRRG